MKLPIDEVKDQISSSLTDSEGSPCRVLLKAPTGSGKSTGLPSILLDAGVEGLIVVVQPRRIAARMLALRVASLRNSRLGDEVGYVVRFDHKMGKNTRIVYITDGVLQRWLEEKPSMAGIGAVVFDEFHERRLAMDIALADCLNLQDSTREDLKLFVMSATLELAGLEEFLEPCKVIEAGGRSFPVEVSYQKTARDGRGVQKQEAVWEKCARAVAEAVQRDDCGNVLVFLPGVYEIQRTIELISRSSWSGGWEVCSLYSALKPELQDRAVREGGPPRIIVSTNVAETSLTIPNVRTVIDSGTARISEFDPVRGVETLFVRKISRAASEQRSGRAGRVADGRCVRLWSEKEHSQRGAFELPEVRRIDITETLLRLKKRGVENVLDFRWLETPTEQSISQSLGLLESLGAIRNDAMTELGGKMATLPLHPRTARLILAGIEEGCVAEAVFTAAALQGEGVFMRGKSAVGRKDFLYPEDGSDFAGEWRAFSSAREMKFVPQRCSQIGVMARGSKELEQSMQQLERVVQRLGAECGEIDFEKNQRAFSRAMLMAYSDQLAMRLGQGTLACQMVGNRRGKLDADSTVKDGEVFLVTEMTEVQGKEVVVYLNRCVGVLLDDVRERFPDDFSDGAEAVYDEKIRRIVNRQQVKFRDLVISSKDTGKPDPAKAAELLAQRVASGELKLKKWDAGVEQWIARLTNLGEWMPELELPSFGQEDREIALETICQGALGYKEIKDREVMPALDAWLSHGQKAALDAYAPTRMTLANGQNVKLKYEIGKPPSIALTVQRLFGVKESPSIANGAVKLSVHICAPNQRPWQMTQDLASFWENGFAQMKKDLAGRYPKHRWEI